MKNTLKNDEEIIAQDKDTTINKKELKTSLSKLVDMNRTQMGSQDLLKN